MSSILVTGGTGFIGSHLVRRLVADGARVHVLARAGSSRARLADVESQLAFGQVSLTDQAALRQHLDETRPRVVFHLAGDPALRCPAADFSDVARSLAHTVSPALTLVAAAATAAAPPALFIRAASLEEYGRGP